MQQFSRSLAPAYAVFCFPSEPHIPEGPAYKKNINTISMHGEKFYQLHTEQRQLLRPLNNLEKGSFRNRENLQYKKTADSVLSSLFMRTNGKCNNSQVPYYHQNIKKTLTLYRCTGRSFTNSTQNNDNCCDKF